MAYARAGSPPQARSLPYPSSNSEKSYQNGKISPVRLLVILACNLAFNL
jgi:hypothetical protein